MIRVAVLAVLLAVDIATAAPAIAGRPLETEDAATLSPGNAELELSGDYGSLRDENVWSARGVFNAGIAPRLEGRFELPVVLLEPDGSRFRAGVGDAVAGVKYRFVDEQPIVPAFLGALSIRVPTGDSDRGLGSKDVDVTLLGVIGKTIGSFIVHGNVGYTFITANRDIDFWTFATSLEHRVTARLSIAGEAVAFVRTASHSSATGQVRTGVIYAIERNVKLDAAIGHGFTRHSPRVLVTIGVTIGF